MGAHGERKPSPSLCSPIGVFWREEGNEGGKAAPSPASCETSTPSLARRGSRTGSAPSP